MFHYKCCIALSDSAIQSVDTDDTGWYDAMVDKAFRGTGINYNGYLGLPFHEFLAVNFEYAKAYITDKLPFFKDLDWETTRFDDGNPNTDCVKYESIRRDIKLRIYEYNINQIPDETKIQYFDTLITVLDIFYDDWFEPSGTAGECTIQHTELKQSSRAE